jgi:choline dehydrogenase
VPGTQAPDVKIGFATAMVEGAARNFVRRHGFMARISLMRPESRGQIRLRSSDPSALPAIDPNCLAIEADRLRLRAAFKLTREVLGQRAFDEYRGEEAVPGASVSGDDDIDAYFRETSELDLHSACTCKMGSDELAVVDAQLKVRGTENLRVVDASVMPSIVTANTNAATIMIAEKASDLILGKSAALADLARVSPQ